VVKCEFELRDDELRAIADKFAVFQEDRGITDDELTIVEEALVDTLEAIAESIIWEYERGNDGFEIAGRLFTQHLEERCAAWRVIHARKAR
jgi:hypothetical protein